MQTRKEENNNSYDVECNEEHRIYYCIEMKNIWKIFEVDDCVVHKDALRRR